MSTEVGKIHYTLDLDDKGLQSGTKRASSAFDSMKKSSQLAVGAIIGGLAISGKMVLQNAADFETMGTSLKSVFKGNVEEANKAQSAITDFSKKTPYQLKEVLGAFILLKNMGLDPSEKALTAYGNTASAMGKTLDQMVQAVADATVGEFERLKEFGIKSKVEGDNITFLFRGVSTTIKNEAGAIEGYLQKIGTVDFAGGMEAQSLTLQGRISTLKDEFSLAMVEFATKSGLMDLAKQAVERLIGVVELLGPKLLTIVEYFKNNDKALAVLSGVIVAIAVPAFVSLGVAIWGALAPLIPLVAIGAIVGAGLYTLIERAGGLTQAMNTLRSATESIKAKFWEVWNVVAPYVMPMFQAFRNFVMTQLVPALQELWTKLSPVLIPALKVIAVILGGIVLASIITVVGAIMAFTVAITGIVKYVNYMVDNVSRGFSSLKNIISSRIEEIKKIINSAAEVMKKLNPLQRFSPSLVDNVKRGTSALIKEYSGLFADIDAMSNRTRFNLAGVTGNVSNITQVNTPQPINVSMNVENYYGDQIGLTNFTEKLMQEIDRINITRNNKLS